MNTIESKLKELEELDKAATPGPWKFEYRSGNHPQNTTNGWGAHGLWGKNGEHILGDGCGWDSDFKEPEESDKSLIATYRNETPKLIQALREAVVCLSKVSSADSRETLLGAADALININKILNGGK